jgi:hypothetical protein
MSEWKIELLNGLVKEQQEKIDFLERVLFIFMSEIAANESGLAFARLDILRLQDLAFSWYRINHDRLDDIVYKDEL